MSRPTKIIRNAPSVGIDLAQIKKDLIRAQIKKDLIRR